MRKLFVMAWLGLAASVAFADEGVLKRLDTGDDTRLWEGVGRLDIGGEGFCTGALIEPDLVLTAAHCLYNKRTGEEVDITKIEFLAGWRNGRASAYRWVRRAVIHPDYAFSKDVDAQRVRNDIALLELQHPISKSGVVPFRTDERPKKGDEIGVVSYARDRSEAPSLQEVCKVLARQHGVLVMSCDVNFGSSGAPVFSIVDGTPRVVSVVSAMAEVDGEKVALGAQLQTPLDDMREKLRSTGRLQTQTKKSLFSNGSNRDTGAKFAKPETTAD